MNSVSMEFFAGHFARPEMQLLLAGCRKLAGTIGEAEWEARISAAFDEAAFAGLCRDNRLTLVAEKTLVRPHRDRFTSGFLEGFESTARRLAFAQLRISKSMIDIHRSFQAGNIRHLFLKGPVLNGVLHGEELLRCSKDLDVLIESDNILKAAAILGELGFDREAPGTGPIARSPFFRLRRKDISFRKNQAGPAIELHWKTDKVEMILNRGIFDWDEHIKHVALHNESLPVMEDYHNCLYLCLHAAKHHWLRLQWLLDIALLIQRRGMDVERLLGLAGRYGLRNVVQEALCLCRRLLMVDFGTADPLSWEKHAAKAVHRFHLANQPISRRINRRIMFHRGLLYPKNGPRQGYWIQCMLERTLQISRKAAVWKT